VNEQEPGRFRVSDAERQSALDALGEHLSSGRLDVDEYGDRSAKITTAKTRDELSAVFSDLPEPRPKFGAAPGNQPATQQPQQVPAKPPPSRAALERVFGALVPLSAIIALFLFFTVLKVFWVFLLPVAVTIIGGAILGDDWQHGRNHRRYRHHRGRY
jgi:hypothetical protein